MTWHKWAGAGKRRAAPDGSGPAQMWSAYVPGCSSAEPVILSRRGEVSLLCSWAMLPDRGAVRPLQGSSN